MAEKYTEAQKRASKKYMEKMTQIKITVTKEQREMFQDRAKREGKSLTQLIIDLMEES